MKETKKWYQSVTVAAIISVVIIVSNQFLGIELAEAEIQRVLESVAIIISSAVAFYGRITATKQLER